eukprot:COSAG02_NODE_30800_length_545_cov_0.885650_2_plen_62_part_01
MSELREVVGEAAVWRLIKQFGGQPTAIRLRRVEATGAGVFTSIENSGVEKKSSGVEYHDVPS